MKDFKKTTSKPLGELLVERGIVGRDQLKGALAYQKQHKGRLIGEILVEMKLATEKDIAQALIAQYHFPYLPVGNYDIASEVLQMVPGDLCRRATLIPIDKIGKNLTVAMANPLEVTVIEQLEELTCCRIQVFVSTASEIKQSISKYYPSS